MKPTMVKTQQMRACVKRNVNTEGTQKKQGQQTQQTLPKVNKQVYKQKLIETNQATRMKHKWTHRQTTTKANPRFA